MNSKVDQYLIKHHKWTSELETIRGLLIETELVESFKWNAPVYSLDGKNVLSLGAFKNHYCIWFFNGVFLKDNYKLLKEPSESTKAMRQISWDKNAEVDLKIIESYVLEAIENQKNGFVIKPVRSKEYEIPTFLQAVLDENKKLFSAFVALTYGKQKEYALYILEAKQHKTKMTRMEKIRPMIVEGIGLHDKYRNC